MKYTTRKRFVFISFVAAAVSMAFDLWAVSENGRSGSLSEYVNPMIGTGNGGNTFPGPVWPMGMVQPGPDTSLVLMPHDHNPADFSQALDYRSMCNGYDPRSDVLLGFTQTHLSGTGCTDLQDFLLLPFTGAYPTNETQRFVAKMDKKSETASAGYYAVSLPEHSVRAEITSSKRVAYHRYTFEKGGRVHIFFDCQAGSFAWWMMQDPNHPRHRVVWSQSKINDDDASIEAYNRVTCWNREREIFTRIEFSKNPVSWCEVPHHFKAGRRYVLDFDVEPGEAIVAKAAVSSVDFAGARKNLASDPEGFDFDARKKDCVRAWDAVLSCAVAEGDDNAKRLFYTALYHAYVQPNLFSDVDGRCRFQDFGRYGKTVSRIHTATSTDVYTTLSTWDTYRAAHPLYTILTPKMAGAVAETMLEWCDEMGKMPKWQMFGGENYCMIGPHSITIVADALTKGLMKSSPKRVLEAVEKTNKAHNGMGNGKSLWDVYYDKIGYLPCDKRWSSVSDTLEWGMVDYAAMRVAELAQDAQKAAYHRKHLKNYRNLYDADSGLMRGRKADGSWRTPFEPYRQWPAKGDWNDYTEGGAMQYSWHVMWDPEGLVELHGGREKFAARLEKLFTDNTEVPADQKTGECSGTIGQFALGNEHDQHVPYLWQYAGRPDRAAEIVRELCERYFFDGTDGLCGNDDCGQISSWYVFACLGFYPLNPVGGEYVIGAPQLPKVTLNLENGKTFTVIAKSLSRENRYVKSITLNGRKMNGFIVKHSDIFNGGELVFEMTDKR